MDCPSLYAFIHDIKRFVLYSRVGIEQAPLQIYCSALVFAPANSQVRKQFNGQMPCWVQKLPDVQKNWGSLLQTLEGHSDNVDFVTFSPDGKLLASASEATVRLWNAATGAALQTLEIKGWARDVTFSPDGKLAVLAREDDEEDCTVQLWDTTTGAILQTSKILIGRGFGGSEAFSPDGKIVASAVPVWGDEESDEGGTVRLWDVATGATLQTLKGCGGFTDFAGLTLAFSPDSKIVAFSSLGMTVRLWDTATGAALQTLESGDWSSAVVFSPDGKTVASALQHDGVQLWDVATCVTWQIPPNDFVIALAFSPDGKLVTSGLYDCTIRLWDAATGVALQTLEGHTGSVRAVAFSPDGKVVASASQDQTVRLWDVATCAASQTLGRFGVSAVAFSPDGTLVASASSDGTVHLWDVETVAVLQTLEGHTRFVNDVTFSPDGKIIASASADNTVRLWDAATGAALHTFKGHMRSVRRVVFSPDSKMVASAEAYVVRLWDATTGATSQTLVSQTLVSQTPSDPDFIRSVSFSPDSKVVAAVPKYGIGLWDTATGAHLRVLADQQRYINAVAFSPDGNIVALALLVGGPVQLWNAATGVALQTLPFDQVDELFFSSEGLYLNSYYRGLSYAQSDSASIFAPAPPPLQTPFRRENWIAQGGENLLWLPPDYRDLLAFKGNVFVFRDISGQVIFVTFSNSVPVRK
jgi:WD40 repeat protein